MPHTAGHLAGVGNIVSVAHGIIGTDKLYLDFTSGGEVDGEYTVTKVDDDNLSFTGSAQSVITAGAGVAYKRVRSLSIQGDESLEFLWYRCIRKGCNIRR